VLGGVVAIGLSIAGAMISAQAPAGGRGGGAQAAPAAPIPADAKPPGPTEIPGAVKGYVPPKTPWGDPDLQGIWPGIDLVGVPMQRDQRYGTRNWLTDEEFKGVQARMEKQALQDLAEFDIGDTPPGGTVGGPVSPPPHWLERGTPQRIASLVIDPVNGQTPSTTEEFKQRQQAAAAARKQAPPRGPADSYTDRSIYDRCITRGIAGSFLPVIYNNGNEIIQGPGFVAVRNEMIHETRIAPLDSRPKLNAAVTSWMGDSRARWEGNTLVVETTNFNDRTAGIGVNGGGTRGSDVMKVVERITRVAPELLVWDMTFDDPKTWVRPWTIRLPLRLDNSYAMAEYACHEGNYSLFNILSGARADDKAAAEAAAKGLPPANQAPEGGRGGRGGRGGGGGGRRGGGGAPQ
jgi:hypothetical protein